ncbi:MAG: TonB-dependent receptor [Bacteroidota bacterium]
MMKNTLLLLLTLCLSSPLIAQRYTVYGKVLSAQSNTPFEEAKVLIQASNRFIETNRDGYFEVSLPEGMHRFEAFSLGMQSSVQNIKLEKNTELNFYLVELSSELEAVEIVAQKRTTGITRLKSVDGFGIYEAKKNEVIVLDDFAANKVANTARQVFAKVPGLNIWESDFAGLQLDIAARGLGPSRTANFNTRQNGYDMSADALGYPESYYMPAMQAIDRIEVVRGAASLQYGTQFGGMLNFKLKEAPDRAFELNAEQAVGSFGLLNSFISVGGRNDRIDYYGYYQYRTGDGWRENSGFDAQTAFGRIGYQVNDKLKLGLEYSYLSYEAQQPGGLTDGQFNNEDLTQSNRARNWFSVNWNLMAATLDYRFSTNTQLNIRSFGLISSRDALGNLEQIGVPDNPRANRTLIRDEFANFGMEARLLHRYKLAEKKSALVVGTRYYNGSTDRRQGEASANNDPDFRFLNPEDPEEFDYEFPSENYAVFLENLTYLSPKLSITAGFRLDHIRTDSEGIWKRNRFDFAGNLVSSTVNFDTSSTTRTVPLLGVGASYYLNDDLHLYTNFARNFRSITFSDLRVVNPNFQLDSLITDENGFNMDIGLRGTLWDLVNLDVSAFVLRYNDRIGQYELPGSTTLFRTNIGNSRHVGMELFAEVDLFNLFHAKSDYAKLFFFLNLSATEATYISSDISAIRGRKVEYVPNVMLRSGLNYRWKNVKSTLQVSHLSEQFSDATNSTFNPNALTGIIPAYTVMDFSVEYQLQRFKISLGANNLTDERYFTRRAESYPGPGIIPATIRSFYASVGVKLGSAK